MSEKSKRLMMIYSRLKSSPVTIEMLSSWAKKNDVQISSRTFYRDLYDLENSVILPNEKLVVAVGEKNRKTWKIEYINQEEPLTEFDINSYILFQKFLPLSIVSSRKDSHEKFASLFYKKYSKSQFENFVDVAKSQIKATHFFEGSVFTDYHKILDDCIWSIQNKRGMELLLVNYDYTSISSHLKFPQVFLPIQILYHRGVVHVSGFLKANNQLLILGLEQIEKYKLTNDPFDNSAYLQHLETELSRRFGITQNINDEIYDIEIEFTHRTGTFVHKQFWTETQNFEQLENGNFIMNMNCGINRELIGWIFQWMSNVKVIKPNILKKLVTEKYKEMVQIYEDDTVLVSNNSYRPL
ncbi:WYL domain-containing protein [Kaistella flava (ex Peng et al. 2021)]|uniref:WYL domain-containing protein n=1 Tax=Kaistella flava (ex Peng et al. 2021) TaxID=2038776 RepID=A0A7M2YAA6_9FLAO|nr:WYL domain-containing protein [Kaistella flava (ex Peng et al. 2021)]QOW11208.1 WYL domain-containing protein [Kaistella flava (ex Peng et al. 2021)]